MGLGFGLDGRGQVCSRAEGGRPHTNVAAANTRARTPAFEPNLLVRHYFGRAFLLRFGQRGRHILERRQMFVDVGLAVLN